MNKIVSVITGFTFLIATATVPVVAMAETSVAGAPAAKAAAPVKTAQ